MNSGFRFPRTKDFVGLAWARGYWQLHIKHRFSKAAVGGRQVSKKEDMGGPTNPSKF